MIVWIENPEVWSAVKEKSQYFAFFSMSSGTDCVTVMQIQSTSEELSGSFHGCN